MNQTCPCNPEKSFKDCCNPLIEGKAQANSPEALMRSRYSAFATKNMDYIYDTTDPQSRHDYDAEGTKTWAENSNFKKLEVLKSSMDGNKGMVEFKAYYNIGKDEHIHHEISKFRKQAGQWYFKDGKAVPPPQE